MKTGINASSWDADRGPFRIESLPPEVEMVVRLRNHLWVVAGANQLLADQWSTLNEDERLQLLSLALRGVTHLNEDVADYSESVEALADPTSLEW